MQSGDFRQAAEEDLDRLSVVEIYMHVCKG